MVRDFLYSEMFRHVSIHNHLLYLRAEVIERDERAQVSLGDFVLHTELCVGNSGGICQFVFEYSSSGKQFHEMRSREIVVRFDDVGSAVDSCVDF
ncbi:MAG: hypothetical protein LBS23_03645 [Holosporaceae bacterium]|nr:hypothetical protein [Holosporaceae bacterium]